MGKKKMPHPMPMESLREHADALEMPMREVYRIEELVAKIIEAANRPKRKIKSRRATGRKLR